MASSLYVGSCLAVALTRTRSGSEPVRPLPNVARLLPSANTFFPGNRSISTGNQAFSRPPSSTTRAIAEQLGSAEPSVKESEGAGKYYFLVANAKFMLDEEEHFKEVLFERRRLFKERNREQDFWLVVEPNFLDKFPSITNRLKRPAVALVSTDAVWITFMKLRLDRVLYGEYEARSVEEVFASKPADLKFPAPDQWTAPYPKYEYGWWETFLPPTDSKPQA